MPMVLMVAVAPLARFLYAADGNHFGIYLPWANLDALLAGALLCIFEQREMNMPIRSIWLVPLLIFVSISLVSSGFYKSPLGSAIVPFVIALSSTILVWQSRIGFAGVIGKIMNSPAIVYIGKISYGIYLYHMVTGAVANKLSKTGDPLWILLFKDETVLGFAIHVGLTLAIAACSFRFFETPVRLWLNRVLLSENRWINATSPVVSSGRT